MSDKSVVEEAIARNISIVLSLPSAGMVRNHKSRFISSRDGGILVQSPEEDRPLIAELHRNKTPCVISFRSGIHKVIFPSIIQAIENGCQLNAQTAVDALLLEFPGKISVSQKRSDYRVGIPPHTEISIRVWRMGSQEQLKDKPVPDREVGAKIFDLSLGGAGAELIGTDGKKPRISPEDRLRVILTYQDEALTLEANMRPPSVLPERQSIIAGIKFKKLEDDLEGRRTMAQLMKIVGELQRAELRMAKLGMKASA